MLLKSNIWPNAGMTLLTSDGITKPISDGLLFSRFLSVLRTLITSWISRSDFTGFAVAQLPVIYESESEYLTNILSK